MPATLTDDGLQIQTLEEIRTELHTALRDPSDGFGPDFVLDEHEAVPMLVGILAEREARVQSLTKAVLDAGVPGSARGIHADNLASVTGTVRDAATFSSVVGTMTGVALAAIPTGRVLRHNPTETLWDSIAIAVLDVGGEATVTLRAREAGPIEIVASSDWSVITGDANLTAFESTADSTPGSNVESDEELEARRVDELATLGKATIDAIAANLQQDVDGLTIAAVFSNESMAVDADGLPAKSVEVLVDDGGLIDDEVIVRAILANVSGGTYTHGSTVVSYVDSRGQTRTGRFTRATQVPVWIRVTYDTTAAEVDIGDEAAIEVNAQEAIDDKGDALPIGRDVVPISFMPAAIGEVPENSVTNVTIERSLDGLAWSSAVLTILPRERAVFATARVVVVFV